MMTSWAWCERRIGLRNRRALPLRASPCEFSSARFPDDRDPDLPRISQLLLDLLGDVPRDDLRLNVVHPVRLDHDADLATGLHREHLVHAVVRGRDLLQPFQPLDVRSEEHTSE